MKVRTGKGPGNPSQNPNPPVPNSQPTSSEQLGGTPTTQAATQPKPNPPRKTRATRSTTARPGKSPNETALPGGDLGNPIPLAEVTASLNNKNRKLTL
ncbi:hypothetical protein Pst134EB_020133 [Puccinia striiformis f. sp. tritici]|nr:hypothetical protein Pst134EB_020133 [Puccinia striiformis f. sp. tritici]